MKLTPRMKLTSTNIARLCVLGKGELDRIFSDDEIPGLGLRVRAGGSRKWILHYRWNGEPRRYTIGHASVLGLEEARRAARRMIVDIDEGVDPSAEKITKRAAAALVFSRVVDDYLAVRSIDLRPSSHDLCSRNLTVHWRCLHRLAISSIDRAIVAARLRELQKEHGIVSANRARSTLSALFVWAIGESLCESNPVIGTNKGPEVARDRVLSTTELVAIWNAAERLRSHPSVAYLDRAASRRDRPPTLVRGLARSALNRAARREDKERPTA
jgi:Arm domain-containing DNA-binding protein/integrase-like protein